MAAVQVGVLISSFLFDVATLQAFSYYVTYKSDPLPLKLFLSNRSPRISSSALVWLLELSGMVFAAHLLYPAAITPYRENPPLMFLDPPHQILATIPASNWSGCAVQSLQAEEDVSPAVKKRRGQNYHDDSYVVAVVAAILNLILP
ncbi:hypothetical protein BDN71DRAFT_1513522 [Pleurotus eryngii]|uniref:Uncharacterized protein n=1 Tax=Pleurotus eryngii TaxID=5323 RepID=A0A9P5ZLB8_PLEER|nr:hypothetical protein BDN71DRAFT_1513522 [Pleurotus eryngii]